MDERQNNNRIRNYRNRSGQAADITDTDISPNRRVSGDTLPGSAQGITRTIAVR